MYKAIQNYQIAELIKERLTSPVACKLTHTFFRGSFEPRMKRARLSNLDLLNLRRTYFETLKCFWQALKYFTLYDIA